MAGMILDGKSLSQELQQRLAVRVQRITALAGRAPILATILVGDDPASATYVKMKAGACKRIGIESLSVVLAEGTTNAELLRESVRLNAQPGVHGSLLQHPVPAQIDERGCFYRIRIEKDVDGVTALGFG